MGGAAPPNPISRISVGSREYIIHLTSTSADYRGETSQPIAHGRIMRRFITILANNSQMATSCIKQRTSRVDFRCSVRAESRRQEIGEEIMYDRSRATHRASLCARYYFFHLWKRAFTRADIISGWPCTCRD
jgi:hypothetical protein